MALSLYDPQYQAFRTWAPAGALSTPDMLMLNILIELKIISHFMSLGSTGVPTEETTNIRNDIVSVT